MQVYGGEVGAQLLCSLFGVDPKVRLLLLGVGAVANASRLMKENDIKLFDTDTISSTLPDGNTFERTYPTALNADEVGRFIGLWVEDLKQHVPWLGLALYASMMNIFPEYRQAFVQVLGGAAHVAGDLGGGLLNVAAEGFKGTVDLAGRSSAQFPEVRNVLLGLSAVASAGFVANKADQRMGMSRKIGETLRPVGRSVVESAKAVKKWVGELGGLGIKNGGGVLNLNYSNDDERDESDLVEQTAARVRKIPV